MREILRQKIVDSIAAPLPKFTRRDVRVPKIPRKAVAVIGMRRTGKTTFLWQLLSEQLAQGSPREALLLFSFEDERIAGMKATDLHIVLEEYYRLYPELRDTVRTVFFLDEMQQVPGWEGFVRRLLDTERIELFISGSSARLLSREVATSMRGRTVEALVYPFTFREYLRHLGREPEVPVGKVPKAARSTLERDLRNYLARGGFPESVGLTTRDHEELLRGYVDTVLLRDVIERHGVSHPIALRWMVRHLLGNAASAFTVNRFYNDLKSQGLSVAKDTLHQYLSYLEDTFLIRTISILAGSERQRMVNPRKVYPIDPGLIPLFDRTGRANVGHSLETCVMLELERRGVEIHYVRNRTGSEVDFWVRYEDGRQELIQVTTSLDDPEVREREVRGLMDALDEQPATTANLIVLEPEPVSGLPEKIRWYAASQWLLF